MNPSIGLNRRSQGSLPRVVRMALPLLGVYSGYSMALPLNDTGLGDNNYSTEATNYYFERLEMTEFPGQDPQYGRDAAAAEGKLSKVGDGRRGFDFSDHNECVKDNVTGLIWEVKTSASEHDVQSQKWTYSWYDAQQTEHPGQSNGGICHDEQTEEKDRIACDTSAYIAKINEMELCGYSDWRLPRREELRSIVDYSQPNVNTLDYEHILPSIDQEYFPNTLGSGYWTVNPYVADKKRVWTVDFEHGGDSNREKTMPHPIRLVSDGEREPKRVEEADSRYSIQSSQGETVAASSDDMATKTMSTETMEAEAMPESMEAETMATETTATESMTAEEEEPGIWDRMLGVFDDDDEEAMIEDRGDTMDTAETEAADVRAEMAEPTDSATDGMSEVPEESSDEEPGFFQKVKDLF